MKKFALSGSAQDPEKYAEDMLHILDGRLGVQLPDASKEAGWAGDAGNWLRNTGGAVKDTVMNQANRMGLAPGNAVRDAQNFGNQAVGTAKGFVNQAVGAGKEFMSGLRGQQPAAAAAAPKPQVGPKPMAGPGYQVQQGDTMSGLAKRQGMSLQDLMTRNPGITNPNVINKGQAINFGTAGNAPAAKPQKARTHEAPQMAAKQQPVPNPTAPAPAAPQNAAFTPPTWMNPPAAAQNMSVQPKTAAEKAAMSLLELYGKVQKGETKVPVPKHLSPMQAAAYSRHYVELANPKTRGYAMRGMRNILGAAKKIKEGPAMPKAAAALVTTKEALFGARARRAAAQRENDDVLHEMSNKEVAMHGGLRGGLGGLLAGGIAGAVHRSEGGSGLSTAGLVGGGTLLGTGVGAGAALLRKNYIKAKRQAEAKRTEQPMPKAAALNPSEIFPASKRDVAGMMDKSHALAKKFPAAAADSMSRLSAASGRNRLAAFNLHDKKVPSLSHLKQIEKRETLQKLIGWKRDSLSKGLEQKAASATEKEAGYAGHDSGNGKNFGNAFAAAAPMPKAAALEKAALQDETLTKLKALARAHEAIPFVPGKNPELSRKMFDLAARQRRHIDDVTAGRGVFPGSEGKVLFHNALRHAAEAKGLSGVKTLGVADPIDSVVPLKGRGFLAAMRRHLLKNAGYAGHDSGNGKNFGNALRKMILAKTAYHDWGGSMFEDDPKKRIINTGIGALQEYTERAKERHERAAEAHEQEMAAKKLEGMRRHNPKAYRAHMREEAHNDEMSRRSVSADSLLGEVKRNPGRFGVKGKSSLPSTLTGMGIGGGLGAGAAYLLGDKRDRIPHLALGAVTGGALGAIVGAGHGANRKQRAAEENLKTLTGHGPMSFSSLPEHIQNKLLAKHVRKDV